MASRSAEQEKAFITEQRKVLLEMVEQGQWKWVLEILAMFLKQAGKELEQEVAVEKLYRAQGKLISLRDIIEYANMQVKLAREGDQGKNKEGETDE